MYYNFLKLFNLFDYQREVFGSKCLLLATAIVHQGDLSERAAHLVKPTSAHRKALSREGY